MHAQERKQSAVHETLQWELCCMLAQQCSAGSQVAAPRRVRACLLEALRVEFWLWSFICPVFCQRKH